MSTLALPQLAANLKEARATLSMTQERVAAAMRSRGHSTWHQTTVGKVENGGRPVWSSELVDLAQLYGQSVSGLLGKPKAVTGALFEDVEWLLRALSPKDLSRAILLAAALMYEQHEGGGAA
jgi:transcriptional regulator with XRE-family HTH domain